jgi:hypothetical protein
MEKVPLISSEADTILVSGKLSCVSDKQDDFSDGGSDAHAAPAFIVRATTPTSTWRTLPRDFNKLLTPISSLILPGVALA